jgi:hypothetical protein
MLDLTIEIRGEDLFCAEAGAAGETTRRGLTDDILKQMRGWAAAYDRAVRSHDAEPLVRIGRPIATLLNQGDSWLDRVLQGTGEIGIEIAVAGTPDERERLLLDVPWELLAPGGPFLAEDEGRLFRVVRRLGRRTAPQPPRFRDLALLFMAADVEGQGALNYEHEEAAILQATRHLDLSVEESGALDFLTVRLAQHSPFEALHLSCHGDLAKKDLGAVARGQPYLALESPEGLMDRPAWAGW